MNTFNFLSIANRTKTILLSIFLNGVLSIAARSQQFPISPNAYNADGKRTGHWTILFDSTFSKEVKDIDSAFYYRLAQFENGQPVGKVRDFYRNGTKQWDGYLLSMTPDVSDGVVNYYYQNGKVAATFLTKSGKRDGFYKQYNAYGILTAEGNYAKDSAEGKWLYYNDDGLKSQEAGWRDNKVDGRVTSFYPSGSIMSRGTKVMNNTEGLWEDFYPDGKPKAIQYYNKGNLEGEYITYFENGQIESKGQYRQGKKYGAWVYYFETGRIDRQGEYDSNGLRLGEWKSYYENGRLLSKVFRKEEKLNGYYEEYYDNGQLKIKTLCENDLWHGAYERYFENGQIEKGGKYVADSLDGYWIFYYDNGKAESEGNYLDNKKHGYWKTYTRHGHPETEANYQHGLLHGPAVVYFPYGKVSQKKNYSNGNENGDYQSFHENGKLLSQGKKIDGKREGEWLYYFDNGQLDTKEYYHNDLFEREYVSYFPTGIKKTEGTAASGKHEGYRKFYFANGRLKGEGLMHDGERQGHWIFYDSASGQKESEGEYIQGKTHGKWKFYASNPPHAYFINGWEETFYNLKDSLKSVLDRGDVDLSRRILARMDQVRQRDFKKQKLEKILMLYWKGYLADAEKNYNEALNYDEQYLERIKNLKGDTCVEYHNGVNNKALVLGKMGHREEERKLLFNLAQAAEKRMIEQIGDIYSIENYAIALNQSRLYDEEASYLLRLLAVRKSGEKTHFPHTARLLTILGDLYVDDLVDYKKGMQVFENIISLGDSLSAQQDAYYGNALYKIGLIHWFQNNTTNAIKFLTRAQKAQSDQLRSAPTFCLNTLNLLGRIYISTEQIDSAANAYNTMQTSIRLLGWENKVWQPICLHGLAKVSHARYERQQAVDQWQKARQLFEHLGMTDRTDYADILQGLSVALPELDRRLTPEAEKYLTEAVSILERISPESTKYRAYLMSLGKFYNDAKRFEKANEIYRKAEKIIVQAEGEGIEYAKCQNLIGENEEDWGKYANAESYYQKALAVFEPSKKQNPSEYIETLTHLSDISRNVNNMEKAQDYMNKAVDAAGQLIGEESLAYAQQLQSMAYLLQTRGLYTDAEKYYRQSADLVRKNMGENSIKYAYLISGIATLYRTSENYKKALTQYLYYKQLLFKHVEEKSAENIILQSNLAYTYEGLGEKTEAENCYQQAVRLSSKVYGGESLAYAWKLQDLGVFYFNEGQFVASERYLKECAERIVQVLGPDSYEYANVLKRLANTERRLDKMAEAETLLIQAVDINKKQRVDHFGSYVRAVEDLQDFYSAFGRHTEARRLLDEILPMIANKWGKEATYALNLHRKGLALVGLSEYDSAKMCAKSALTIMEDLFAPSHWMPLDTHNLLGIIALKQFDFDEAERQYRHCVEQRKIAGHASTSFYSTALNNLSAALIEKKRYEEAELNLKQALQIDVKLNEKAGANFCMLNLGKLYTMTGKFDQAETHIRQALAGSLSILLTNFYFLSDAEKAQYWKANRLFIDRFQSFAVQRYKSNPAIAQELYNLQLNTKGILLSTSNKIKKRILSSGDSTMIRQYFHWLKQRDQLAQWYVQSGEELKANKNRIDSLETITRRQEKDLNISSEDLENDKGSVKSWRDIQKLLSSDEASIEIVRLRHHVAHATDSVLYAALVLTSEMKNGPQMIVFPNGNFLEGRALKFYKNSVTTQTEDNRSYENYWKPLESVLKSKSKLFLSLDGVYNSININTLKKADGKYLVDGKDITLVANSKDIILLKSKRPALFTKTSAGLLGYPKYFLGKEFIKQRAPKERSFDYSRISDEDRSGIAELPGTKKEIEKVNEILTDHQWQVKTFTSMEASEEVIKNLRQPGLLHIATHGFFSDEKETTVDPMLRAGLLFAGSANYLQDKVSASREDGVLTAYEAANLNLDNTEMVVLSACETGKGEVQNGEGVYGLQRAFQTAGAKSILMSLWKVDDAATQELMTAFYQHWMAGKTKAEAFRTAQLQLKEKYVNPYFWGSFVMMGE